MSTVDVAKKDFLDVRRAKIVWFVGAFYTLFMVLLVYFGQNGRSDPTILGALWNLTAIGAMFIPLIALVTAYLAIAGERESGGIKYLLSIPNSRRDVVRKVRYPDGHRQRVDRRRVPGGRRAHATVVPLARDGHVRYHGGTDGPVRADLRRRRDRDLRRDRLSLARAMGGSIAFFFITSVLNVFGSAPACYRLRAQRPRGPRVSMNQIAFVQSLVSPTAAYVNSTGLAFPEGFNTIPPDLPWFLQGETMLVVMLAWLVVPLALGIWQFETRRSGLTDRFARQRRPVFAKRSHVGSDPGGRSNSVRRTTQSMTPVFAATSRAARSFIPLPRMVYRSRIS